MRLIDAYMLLQAMDNKYAGLIEEHKNTPDIAEAFILIDELIKNQPTAQDMEAVVQQLETEAKIAESNKERYYHGTSQYEFARGYLQAICAALSIVKEGGVK